MLREIIKIDDEKCDGCGLCVPSCDEGALKIIDGKARLVEEVYCDGLGACLGTCPQGALTIEKRESEAFDEDAVVNHLEKADVKNTAAEKPRVTACPGSLMRMLDNDDFPGENDPGIPISRLRHWPVQLMLVPPGAPYLKNAAIVICADCVPFALAGFHERYLKGRAVLVGCPKLDDLGFYQTKLEAIFREAAPESVTVLRMEVPCCGGIAGAVIEARDKAAPGLPVDVHTIGIQGGILKEEKY